MEKEAHVAHPLAENTDEYYQQLLEAAKYVREHLGEARIALVLGSGLKDFVDVIENKKELSYTDIPYMPTPTVKGHPGTLIRGTVQGLSLFCLAGRTHAYEGTHMYQITFAARLMKLLGCKLFIATNAAGGSGAGMYPGAIMVISDHVNLFHRNPLHDTYEHSGLSGPRHAAYQCLYSPRMKTIAEETAGEVMKDFKLFSGVYGSTCGPTYETPAEVKAGCKFGVSAFGMSTVPETSVAAALGMEVFAMSLITNMAAGMSDEHLTHAMVQQIASQAGPNFVRFMKLFFDRLAHSDIKKDFELEPHTERSAEEAMLNEKERMTPTPLPLLMGAVAPKHFLLEASEFVFSQILSVDDGENTSRENTSVELSTMALYLGGNKQEAALLHTLTNLKKVPYSRIPHFSVISASGRDGYLLFGTLDDKWRVCCLAGNHWEGFSCEESVFLSRLLRILGITTLVHTFVLDSCDETLKPGAIVALSDAVDFTTVHPVPQNVSLQQFMAETAPFTCNSLLPVISKAAEALDISYRPNAEYMAFPGPTLPTPAEIAIAQQIGCHLFGLSSLSTAWAAQANGIEVCGLAAVGGDIISSAAKKERAVSEYREEELSASTADSMATLLLAALRSGSDKATPRPEDEPNPIRYFEQQMMYELAPEITQGDYQHVESAAECIKELLGKEGVPSVAILSEKDWEGMSHQLKELKLLENVPHAPSGCTLYRAVVGDQQVPVLWVAQSFFMNEGRPFWQIAFAVRLLNALGVKTLLFGCNVASCTARLQLGDSVVITDHINLSGRNPLFGHNEDRWGDRFPDMSNAYNQQLRQKFIECGKTMGMEVKEACSALVVGPIYPTSAASGRLAAAMGADVVTTGTVPEVIVARHMSLKLAVLARVVSVFSNVEDGVAEAASTTPTPLAQLIACTSPSY